MAKVSVKNIQGGTVGDIELDDSIFASEVNEHLLWEVVKWQLAKRRRGTHSTKTRAEVRGTKAKPYKQKGTGRARAGSRRSPVWVGGGITFGPKPRDYSYQMPKKARKRALCSALSLRVKEAELVVVDDFSVDGKTKSVIRALEALGSKQPDSSVLIVDVSGNELLIRGAKNLSRSKWLAPQGLNVYDVLNHKTLVMTRASVAKVEEVLRS